MEPMKNNGQNGKRRSNITTNSKKTLVVFVDGSWSSSKPDKAGWGFVTLQGEVAKGVVRNPKSRQVDGELKATVEAIRYAYRLGYTSVEVRYDYQGVAKWAEGEWKAKSAVAKQYVDVVTKARNYMNISFSKISGEANPADIPATEALGIQTVHGATMDAFNVITKRHERIVPDCCNNKQIKPAKGGNMSESCINNKQNVAIMNNYYNKPAEDIVIFNNAGIKSPLAQFWETEDTAGNTISGLMAKLAVLGKVKVAKVVVDEPQMTQVIKDKKTGEIKVDRTLFAEAAVKLTNDLKAALAKVGYKLELTKPTTKATRIQVKDKLGKVVRKMVVNVIISHKNHGTAEDMLHRMGLAPAVPKDKIGEKAGSLCKYYLQRGVPVLECVAMPSPEKGFGDGQAYMHEVHVGKLAAVLNGILARAEELPSTMVTMVERALAMLPDKPSIKGFATGSTLFGKGNIKLLSNEDWKAMFGDTPHTVDGLPVIKGDANWFKFASNESMQRCSFMLHDVKDSCVKKRRAGLALTERLLLFDYSRRSVARNLEEVKQMVAEHGVSQFVDRNELADVDSNGGMYSASEIGKVRTAIANAITKRIFSTEDSVGYFVLEAALPHWGVKEDEILLHPKWKKYYEAGKLHAGYRAPVLGPQALYFGKVRFDDRVSINAIVFGNNEIEAMLADNLGADFDGDSVFLIRRGTELHKAIMAKYNGVAPRLPKSPLGLVGETNGKVSRDLAIANSLVAQWAVGITDNYLSYLLVNAIKETEDPNAIIDRIWDGIEATQGVVKMIKKPGQAPVFKASHTPSDAHKMTRGKGIALYADYVPGVDDSTLQDAISFVNECISVKAIKPAAVEGRTLNMHAANALRRALLSAVMQERKVLMPTATGYEGGLIADVELETTRQTVNDAIVSFIKDQARTPGATIDAGTILAAILVPQEGGKHKPEWYAARRIKAAGRVLPGFKFMDTVYTFDKDNVDEAAVHARREAFLRETDVIIGRIVLPRGINWSAKVAGRFQRHNLRMIDRTTMELTVLDIKPGKSEVVESMVVDFSSDYVDAESIVSYCVRRIGSPP